MSKRWHPGGGKHQGARWMPGGGRWHGPDYAGGSPHLVNGRGFAIAGKRRGRPVAVQRGRTLQQEMDARAAAHGRRMADTRYAAETERESARYARASLAHVRGFMRHEGGIAPGGNARKGDDEYTRLPHWAKNERGVHLDTMASLVGHEFPGLGIRSDNDLAAYLDKHQAQRERLGAGPSRLTSGRKRAQETAGEKARTERWYAERAKGADPDDVGF